MEMKPVRNTKDFKAVRAEAERLWGARATGGGSALARIGQMRKLEHVPPKARYILQADIQFCERSAAADPITTADSADTDLANIFSEISISVKSFAKYPWAPSYPNGGRQREQLPGSRGFR